MTIDEAEAALIREAADRVLRGESVWVIATDWNARRIPSVNGKQWSVNVLLNILRSPRIAGLFESTTAGRGRGHVARHRRSANP